MQPIVDTNSRESLIAWLCWNDRNGCYTDEDSIAEFGSPATLEELRECYINQTREV